MNRDDIENYENASELGLFKEYRDVVALFNYVVETDRRFYLCNSVELQARPVGNDIFFELTLTDAWVWDIYRPSRFVKSVRVVTFKDVNIEELTKPDLDIPLIHRTRFAASSTNSSLWGCRLLAMSRFCVCEHNNRHHSKNRS